MPHIKALADIFFTNEAVHQPCGLRTSSRCCSVLCFRSSPHSRALLGDTLWALQAAHQILTCLQNSLPVFSDYVYCRQGLHTFSKPRRCCRYPATSGFQMIFETAIAALRFTFYVQCSNDSRSWYMDIDITSFRIKILVVLPSFLKRGIFVSS